MNKIYWVSAVCAYLFASCAGQSAQDEHEHHHEPETGHVHVHTHGHDHEHEHEHEGHEHEQNRPGEVTFKKAMAEAIQLQTLQVKPSTFTDVIKTSGQILAAQGTESTVVATVPGIISLGNVPFVEGTSVGKGQSVLSISSQTISEGDVAVKARVTYETAQREFERMQSLVEDKIVSAKEFEQARLTYETAKLAFEAVAGKHTAKGVSVVAPLNGYLKNIQVKEGDYVSVGQPLATIAQDRRLVLRADVSEKYYTYISGIQSANFMTPYDNTLYKLSVLGGRLLSYGKASDENSFYLPVTFEFDNKGAVIPGSFVDVYLLTKPMENVLSVPVNALIEEQGIYSVYTRVDEEHFKKQWVTLGANNGSDVQILSGLKAGDEVVIRGAYQLKLSSASNAIPAHTHHH